MLKIDPTQPVGLQRIEVIGWKQRERNAGMPIVHVDERLNLAPDGSPTAPATSALRVLGIDHVVVLADDVRQACTEIEDASGVPLKRVKEGERGTQGFFRFGSVILEVVERRLVERTSVESRSHEVAETVPPLSLWGFVVIVENLDDLVRHLGPDVIGTPREAVQSGRRIATVRSGAGLGVPLAFMTP